MHYRNDRKVRFERDTGLTVLFLYQSQLNDVTVIGQFILGITFNKLQLLNCLFSIGYYEIFWWVETISRSRTSLRPSEYKVIPYINCTISYVNGIKHCTDLAVVDSHIKLPPCRLRIDLYEVFLDTHHGSSHVVLFVFYSVCMLNKKLTRQRRKKCQIRL